jgi:glutathione S-transferase
MHLSAMILIGQYDSPFVRRVAIALRLYGLPFEHRPWSTFGEGDRIAPFNPLRRVPTLVLDGGEALIESTAILDYLDELVGPDKAMIAADGPARRHALKVCALATGLGDKAVSLVYERVLRKDALKLWVERCEAQIGGVLDVLEKERAAMASPYWFGDRIGHADIAVACVLRFTGEAHPALLGGARYPALTAHAARCEGLPAFVEIVQPLKPPSGD